MTTDDPGIIPGVGSPNGSRRYNVTSSLIDWAHTQYDPCDLETVAQPMWWRNPVEAFSALMSMYTGNPVRLLRNIVNAFACAADLCALSWQNSSFIVLQSFQFGATKADSRFAPSQRETSLQTYAVSHRLGANLESALCYHPYGVAEWRKSPGGHCWYYNTGTIPSLSSHCNSFDFGYPTFKWCALTWIKDRVLRYWYP